MCDRWYLCASHCRRRPDASVADRQDSTENTSSILKKCVLPSSPCLFLHVSPCLLWPRCVPRSRTTLNGQLGRSESLSLDCTRPSVVQCRNLHEDTTFSQRSSWSGEVRLSWAIYQLQVIVFSGEEHRFSCRSSDVMGVIL